MGKVNLMVKEIEKKSDNQYQKLRDYGLTSLGKRELSVAMLRKKLEVKAAKLNLENSEDLAVIMAEFIEKSWVSDDRFAESFLRDQIMKQNGPIKIRFNSLKYGLDRDLLDEKIEAFYGEDLQREVLADLAEERTQRIRVRNKKISDFELRSKLTAYLAGKGFSYDLIQQIL